MALAQLMNKPVYVFDPIYEEWNWWNQTTRQWEQCDDMSENPVPTPLLQEHTAIVGTRELAPEIRTELMSLFSR